MSAHQGRYTSMMVGHIQNHAPRTYATRCRTEPRTVRAAPNPSAPHLPVLQGNSEKSCAWLVRLVSLRVLVVDVAPTNCQLKGVELVRCCARRTAFLPDARTKRKHQPRATRVVSI